MSSRILRSNSRHAATSGSRGPFATAPKSFVAGSRGLSATAPESPAAGSRGLSATAPKSLAAGSRGLSATALKSPAAGSRGLSATASANGLTSTNSSNNSTSPIIPGTLMSLQHHLSPIISPFETTNTPSNPPLGLRFGSPDTASTTSAGQQTPTRDPSPIDLNDEHGSTEPRPISSLNVRKTVDQILQTLSLELCEHKILELLTTSAWVDWEGANFMTYTEFGNRQYRYVRPCYRDLYQILNDMWQGEKPDVMAPQHCALITGTPGIGKSIFGEMLCTVISQRPKPTILFYEDKETNGKILIWQKKAFEVDVKQAVEVVKKLHSAGIFSANSHDEDLIEIWSIGDTSIPVLHRNINRICITSPGQARIGDFSSKLKFWVKKNKAITLVVPPCNWEETCFIRLAHDFKHVCSLETLRERFELWGGVPRSIVLRRGLTPERADSEFHNLKITEAMRYLGSYDLDHYHQPGKLFHLLPCFKSLTAEEAGKMTLLDRYDSSNARYYWASEALERKAWATYRNEKEADVVDYVLTLNNDPASRGKVWEGKMIN